MDLTLGPLIGPLLRWGHVAVGVLWTASLLSFALGGSRTVTARDRSPAGEATSGARTLRLLRWTAALTWVSGMLLTVGVYYALDQLVRREIRLETKYGMTMDFTRATEEPVIGQAAAVALSLGVIAAGFLAYEGVWRALGGRARLAAAACYALFVAALYALSQYFTGRAVFMHAGALLGTAMAMNAWMRRAAGGPDAARRSRHDAYMAVPAILAMVATHDAAIYDRGGAWIVMAVVVAASWAATAWLQGRSPGAMVAAPSSP
jgi:uncharacterized membrane protein